MDGELRGRKRRARAKELERLMRQLDEADRRDGLGSWPAGAPARPRRPASRRTTWLLSSMVTVLVLAVIVALHPGPEASAVRRLLGFDDDRILAAPSVPDADGAYEFVATQRDGKTPVGYDPCKVIEIEVNPSGAPEDHRELVDTATAHVSEATGLAFEVIGTTSRRPGDHAGGTGRRPVLVAWADEDEVDDLAGDVAGVAGSQAVSVVGGKFGFVTGSVVLDTDVFDDAPREQLQAIVDHEFGHLVGLDHVDDPNELMYAENVGVTSFGPGDLKGLALLGRLPCG